ncbi:MAG: serine/threonine protein kinase [Candidatus Obscuribacter sp.]|nr:serine/threonine protein kinase [Candidatus Obscuribacter sp.]
MSTESHNIGLSDLLEGLPVAMPGYDCTLAADEITKLPERYNSAQDGLVYLSWLDRLGSILALMWHSKWYFAHLVILDSRRHLFVRSAAGTTWAVLQNFEKCRSNYLASVLRLQAPGYGSSVILSWLPLVLFWFLMLVSFKGAIVFALGTLISWAGYRFVYTMAPQAVQERWDRSWPGRLAKSPAAITIKTGLKNLRPFFLLGLCLSGFTIPFIMFFHWLGKITGFNAHLERRRPVKPDTLILPQNLPVQRSDSDAFFDSPAFAITIMTILLSGIPAYLTYWLYLATGANAFFGNPIAHMLWWQFFLKYFYLGSVGCGLAVLFVKAWFTFPLNFVSTQYDIEVNPDKIIKDNVKGWFGEVMFYGFDTVYHNSELSWHKVVSVDCQEGVGFRYYPLPVTVFKPDSSAYKVFNAIAAFMDAISIGKAQDRNLTISDCDGATLRVRLYELDERQRIDLLTAIRKYAPQAQITDRAQEALVGAAILKDASHTELWFSLLAGASRSKAAQLLARDEALDDNLTDPVSGSLLKDGKFKIISKLASGGQATIYDALLVDSDERLVIKEFVLADGDGVESLLDSAREFENESLILSRLNHPQIVKLIDMFVANNRAYLAIEYAEGKTLRQLVNEKGAQDQVFVIGLAEQMCDILQYLATLDPPVVHRDFTPDNLLIDETGQLKLIDFSISQLYQDNTQAECAGKHSYTPPEQYRGQATPQSDIYAFGATIYFLLTGVDPVAISVAHPRAINDTVGDKFDQYVAHATAIKLEERFESAQWARMDLDAVKCDLLESKSF